MSSLLNIRPLRSGASLPFSSVEAGQDAGKVAFEGGEQLIQPCWRHVDTGLIGGEFLQGGGDQNLGWS